MSTSKSVPSKPTYSTPNLRPQLSCVTWRCIATTMSSALVVTSQKFGGHSWDISTHKIRLSTVLCRSPDTRGGSRIFERGGGSRRGYRIFHKHPPPLGHCPRDVISPQKNWKTPPLTSTPPWTLSAWRHPPSGKTPPLLDIHKHTPLGHCPRDVIHIPRGGWSPLSHTHPGSATGVHLRSTSKEKGGGPTLGPMLKSLHRGPKGGRTPWTPPPWIRHWTRWWTLG